MSHTNDEILYINLEYKSKELYESFNNLPIKLLEDIPAKYINEFKKNTKEFRGETIADLKLFLNSQGIETTPRTDLVAEPEINDPVIKSITSQLVSLDIKPGLITFFKQTAGNDVSLHKDFPYRKNCLLMIPIFYNEYKPSSAITYYKNGGSYNITQPVIMNIMKSHGVRNITNERLMLHIELPDLPFDKLSEILDEKFKHKKFEKFKAYTFTEWSCESLIPESDNY